MARTKKDKPKPITEIKLSELQERYLATQDNAVWEEMFSIMINYARSLVLKQTKGKVFLDPDHVSAVSTDAAIKIMKRYHEEEGFKITHSFGGLLRWKVIESLYGGYQEDNHISLNHVVSSEGGHVTELGDLQSTASLNSLYHQSYEQDLDNMNSFDIRKIVNQILNEFDQSVDSYRLSMLGRVYLLLIMRKSKIRHSVNIFKRVMDIRPREEEVLDLLMLEVRNRVVPHQT